MAISIIYTINNTAYYYKGFTDQFNKDLNYRNNSLSSSLSSKLPIPFIFIINNDNKDIKNIKREETIIEKKIKKTAKNRERDPLKIN